ncbi:tetratricopeptide repeat protein 25-like isoform X1 [Denticeps clupeoides]|uniref:tetratricopeptide repeat protein 25-like isoform X1 n=1 Tax=Denticeps clupeoides TaxID=299321 RepID=UPI0010A3E023|nr:tetratricopeptide repeat protein 25-like isoform X1 [Denticeps clupeoides]XP_028841970.1 tetratricopeptide repeat protein 25-like isoform X1 [Denticeps clupeoides]
MTDAKSTFFSYVAEGDQFYQKGEFSRATESYSTALAQQPQEKNCLVARSRCYVKMGDSAKALQDAEASLQEDKTFFRGLYQKAEALYAMGEFEFALVYYHRGYKLRPELHEFRWGIQKAQEAIYNCVGSPSGVKLEKKGDLSFLNEQVQKEQSKAIPPGKKVQQPHRQKTPSTERTSRQLLGELYSDKEYLEKLLKNQDVVKRKTRSGDHLQELIMGYVSYLDTCTEFWQQQRPIYARQRERKLLQQHWSRSSPPSGPMDYILSSCQDIDAALSVGNATGSLKKAREVLKKVQGFSEGDLPQKSEVLGSIYSCIGNALMDLGQMDEALENHQKDLELAEQCLNIDGKSRALVNIGRLYACTGQFTQAIKFWETSVPLTEGGLDKAWLFHEIGWCHLELRQHAEAWDYSRRLLTASQEICDELWQLNAYVLMGQAELKMGSYKSSIFHFEEALQRARLLQNDAAEEAIQKALQEARQHVSP